MSRVSSTDVEAAPVPSEAAVDRSGKQRLRRWLLFARVCLDALAFSAAWTGAWLIRTWATPLFERPLNPAEVYFASLPAVVAGCIVTSFALGGYVATSERSPLAETGFILKASFLGLLVAMSFGFLFKDLDVSRSVVLMFGGLSLLFLPVARKFSYRLQNRLVKLGVLGHRVLILGAGETGIRALQKVQEHPEIGYRVVGFLDDDPDKHGRRIGRTPVLGGLGRLTDWVRCERIDEVIIAMPSADPELLMDLVMQLEDANVHIRMIADLFGVLSRETQIDVIEDIPVYDLAGAQASWRYSAGKRVFDLAFGLAGFVVLVLLLPWIALAVKLDSRGPVFFLQERVGEGGRRFRMWKFRTMRSDTDAYAVAPQDAADQRVTRVGAWLRKTSLDELPQVINVLNGEMSIVGPRPEMPFIVEQYNDWQRKRLDVKPGITGLWQILGRKDLPLHENLEYDFYYIKNRSLFLDLVIVAKTVPSALSARGAY